MSAGVELGCTELATNQTITASQVDIPGLSVPVTVSSGDAVFVEGEMTAFKDGTANWVALLLYEDGVEIQGSIVSLIASGYGILRVARSRAPSAGTHTYKLQGVTGGGTALIATSASVVPFIRVTAR